MKKFQEKNYSYDGSVLLRARKRLKISLEQVSKELTLSVSQIKSIEENLSHGYATAYFRKLAIERYASILNISIHKVISSEENEPIILDSTKPNPAEPLNNFFSQYKNMSMIVLSIILFIILFVYLLFIIDQPKEMDSVFKSIVKEEIDSPDNLESSPMIVSAPEETINTDNLTSDNIIDISSQPTIDTDQSFICTIESSPVTSFTTKMPDKPSSYFHIESLADQTICTVDSGGNLKTYNLIAGSKLTHRGKPPFKIQLNPTASTLYFQGWIVYLNANNKFIQLDPTLPPLTD
jgi:cytoskeletal protein RodZ